MAMASPAIIPQQPTSTPAPIPEPEGSAVLLIGPSGTGKTYSTTTLLQCPGIEDIFYFGTENRFMETVEKSIKERNLPIDRVHWASVFPFQASWDTLIQQTNTIALLNYEGLTKIKTMSGKEAYNQFVQIYMKLGNFIDERTGKSYGPVDSWGPNRALIFDGISGAAVMAMHLIQGGKPVAHEGEWGVAMNQLEVLLMKLTSACKCFLVIIGHIEREPDPTGGGTMLTVSTLGRKLSPKIGRNFSEIVLCRKEIDKFYWDTAQMGVDLKTRVLPIKPNLEPHFRPIVEAWHQRLKQRSAA